MRRAITLLAAAAIASACVGGFSEIGGDGDILTEARDLTGFDSVSLSGIGSMTLAEGDYAVSVKTDANLMEYVETSVRGGTLVVGQRTGVNLDPTDGIQYTVSLPELNDLEVSGVGRIDVDQLDAADLRVDVSGVGGISIRDLEAERVVANLSGVGTIDLEGTTAELEVDASGTGSFEGGDLAAEDAVVASSGVGSVTVWATGTLDIDASGIGSVRYYGAPSVTVDSSGLSGLESLGSK